MPKTATTPWDPAEHLETEEDMAAYLEAALDDGDPTLVAAALGVAEVCGETRGFGQPRLDLVLGPPAVDPGDLPLELGDTPFIC